MEIIFGLGGQARIEGDHGLWDLGPWYIGVSKAGGSRGGESTRWTKPPPLKAMLRLDRAGMKRTA